MEFLNKLYANENFGMGLFCVIIFLVIMFLVVLFLGKKDEKKRKLEETNKLNVVNNDKNAFSETTVATPVEVPAVEPPIVQSVTPIEPVIPVEPISYEPTESEKEVMVHSAPNDTNFVDNMSVVEPSVEKVIESPVVEPVIPNTEQASFAANDVIEPVISVEQAPINIVEDSTPITPIIEPINIQIPDEVVNVAPTTEEIKPIIEEMPISNETYYNPVEPIEATTVDVPAIDFDAIAKSISKELDDLEKESKNSYVEVTPMEEITTPISEIKTTNVDEPVKVTVAPKTKIELPKKIDLPAKKDEIEPESYQI